MAILSAHYLGDSYNESGKDSSATLKYRVKTDLSEDSISVRANFASRYSAYNNPTTGNTYAWLYLNDVRVNKAGSETAQERLFDVELSYKQITTQEAQDDPFSRNVYIESIGSETVEYVSLLDKDGNPFINTAGIFYTDLPTQAITATRISIVRNETLAYVSSGLIYTFADKVNSADWTLGFNGQVFQSKTVWLRGINATYTQEEVGNATVEYFRTSYDFLVRPDGASFSDILLPNVGRQARVIGGDCGIVDIKGRDGIINDPWPLSATGEIVGDPSADCSSINPTSILYQQFKVKDTTDLNLLGF